jgi:hypothetical protein
MIEPNNINIQLIMIIMILVVLVVWLAMTRREK